MPFLFIRWKIALTLNNPNYWASLNFIKSSKIQKRFKKWEKFNNCVWIQWHFSLSIKKSARERERERFWSFPKFRSFNINNIRKHFGWKSLISFPYGLTIHIKFISFFERLFQSNTHLMWLLMFMMSFIKSMKLVERVGRFDDV